MNEPNVAQNRDPVVLGIFGFLVGGVSGALSVIVWRWTGSPLLVFAARAISIGAAALGVAALGTAFALKSKRSLVGLGVGCVVFSIPTFVISFTIFDWLESERLANVTNRALQLVDAIKRYQSEHQAPPATLEILVPNYLPAIPRTGVNAHQEYTYRADANGEWQLEALCDPDPNGRGELIYRPSENYTTLGATDLVGHWAHRR